MSKTILITGASTGIGASTALALAQGNTLFLHYNESQSAAEKVADGVTQGKGQAHLIQADLMSEEGCRKLFQTVSEKTDALDVLINNAGGMIHRHTVDALEWDLMEKIFALNTYSSMMMTTLCIPLLKKGTAPCIVNVTSIAMRSGGPTSSIYAASKGAMDSFTRGSARELAPHIRVNAVAPGVILTPFHEKVSSAEKMAQFKKDIPLGDYGQAEEIAHTIAFLIDNPFITGETIDVNGGHFMR